MGVVSSPGGFAPPDPPTRSLAGTPSAPLRSRGSLATLVRATPVAIFTDNDFDKTNGVTTTLRALLRYAPPDLRPRIYTMAHLGVDDRDYLALTSVGMPIPWYPEMRMYLPRLSAFLRHVARDGVELIHLTTPGPVGLAARYLSARAALPMVGSFHTQLAEYTTILSGSAKLGQMMNVYMRWLYGRCERLLVPSQDTRQRLAAAGWNVERATIWPRGVDACAFSPERRSVALRERWHVSARRPAVLYAGRVSREKGLGLLEALSSLFYQRGLACQLIVAGDGPMLDELRAACPDAVFMGRVPHEEMGTVMASADLFVFPSETDTAGNVVLEAQASGLPVLVSDRGGPAEQMIDGKTGFICRSGHVQSFFERAELLLRCSDRRLAMSSAAREHGLSRSWPSALQPLFAAYRDTVAAREPSTALSKIHEHPRVLAP
jgi:glycosyltransferase involved in cell wall biosynthesis